MKKKKSNLQKNGFVYLIIASTLFALILSSMSNPFGTDSNISVSEALEMVDKGSVKEIIVEGEKLYITNQDGKQYTSSKEVGVSLIELMKDSGIDPIKSDVNIIVKSLLFASSITSSSFIEPPG